MNSTDSEIMRVLKHRGKYYFHRKNQHLIIKYDKEAKTLPYAVFDSKTGNLIVTAECFRDLEYLLNR